MTLTIYDLEQFQPLTQCVTCKHLYPVIERDIYAHGRHGYAISHGCVRWNDIFRDEWLSIWMEPCWDWEEK
jgi:hypothetical protein